MIETSPRTPLPVYPDKLDGNLELWDQQRLKYLDGNNHWIKPTSSIHVFSNTISRFKDGIIRLFDGNIIFIDGNLPNYRLKDLPPYEEVVSLNDAYPELATNNKYIEAYDFIEDNEKIASTDNVDFTIQEDKIFYKGIEINLNKRYQVIDYYLTIVQAKTKDLYAWHRPSVEPEINIPATYENLPSLDDHFNYGLVSSYHFNNNLLDTFNNSTWTEETTGDEIFKTYSSGSIGPEVLLLQKNNPHLKKITINYQNKILDIDDTRKTVSFWVKIVELRPDDVSYMGINFNIPNLDSFIGIIGTRDYAGNFEVGEYIYLQNNSTHYGHNSFSATTEYSQGDDVFITIQYSLQRIELYVNTINVLSVNIDSGVIPNSSQIGIGLGYTNGQIKLELSQLKLFNRSITTEEQNYLYTNGKASIKQQAVHRQERSNNTNTGMFKISGMRKYYPNKTSSDKVLTKNFPMFRDYNIILSDGSISRGYPKTSDTKTLDDVLPYKSHKRFIRHRVKDNPSIESGPWKYKTDDPNQINLGDIKKEKIKLYLVYNNVYYWASLTLKQVTANGNIYTITHRSESSKDYAKAFGYKYLTVKDYTKSTPEAI